MTVKTYLLGVGASTILCWIAFFLVLYNIDPFKATNMGLASFLISLFFAIFGTAILIFAYLHIKYGPRGAIYSGITASFRYALLFSIIIVGLLGLQMLRVLTWWVGILFASSILLIEAYFRVRWLGKT